MSREIRKFLRAGFGSCALMAVSVGVIAAGCSLKPHHLTTEDMNAFASGKRAAATAGQAAISGTIDLYDATARALKYNLDARVEAFQRELKLRDYDLSTYKMLPNVVANTGYAARNNDSGGISQSLITGRQSLEASTSQDRRIRTADLAFSWNILDFGLSYVRARQAADEVLIANEARRKAINRIIEDVRTAYWRAVSSERLATSLRALEARVEGAIKRSRRLYAAEQTSPVTALTYERELVEIKREIQRLEGELRIAKTQLAALMNVDPGQHFTLAHKPHGYEHKGLRIGADEMVEVALRNRPELAEVALKKRINAHEAHAALLELLPGLQLYKGSNFDSNHFLYNSDWVSWGAKAGWNLVRLVQYPARRAAVDAADDLLGERALAVTMAILTQVYVSRVRYGHTQKELATAAEYLDVQERLIRQIRAQAAGDKISEQTLIREEMNTLVARVKRDIAFSAYQNAIGTVYATMGLDPCDPSEVESLDVNGLAALLRTGKAWQGGFPPLPAVKVAGH